ncbi:hypothetical protein [Nitrosospira briensis]|uniref:hypothetical protein n=1 Tax=Nitrosospira briensis TaxID=35799 RepID=UPI0004690CD5|nr:hypothetical protein [Nitrosospira briensis]
MPTKKQKTNIASRKVTPQLFIRKLHGAKNLRAGLSQARAMVNPEQFPSIAKQLSQTPLYETLLAPVAFPMSMAAITRKPTLSYTSTEGELMWCASVLTHYVEALGAFVKQRDKYYDAILGGDYDQAERVIDEIQETYGFSIWLIGNRLQLLQATKGLQPQKSFLEEFVSTEGINRFIAWIVYFLSLRAEDNISYTGFEQEASDVLDVKWVRDYVLLHWLPNRLIDIEDPGQPIWVEETHPVIDRFETFIAMSLRYCIKSGEGGRRILVSAIQQVESTGDSTLRRILMVLRDGYVPQANDVLGFADAYTEGRYEDVINSNCESLELVARAYAFTGQRPRVDGRPGLRQQAIALMYDVLSMAPEAPQSRQSLKKVAVLCPSLSFTFQVAAFLERDQNYIVSGGSSELALGAALSSSLNNPWSISALDRISGENKWLDQLLNAHPNSSALRLREAVTTGNYSILNQEFLRLPPYRKAMYVGYIYFHKGDFNEAISSYQLASGAEIDFVSNSAKRNLFDVYNAAGELYKSVQLAIDQILQIPSAAQSYPLESLAKDYVNHPQYSGSMDLAILLSLAIRHGSAKVERDLSNIYENVLAAEGVIKPSELAKCVGKYSPARLIYFLRYVCVPRTLDDATCFDTVEEIDIERIAVCQLLLQLDPPNLTSYQAEIRVLTRGLEVANLLTKMQTSKIYVDEAGVREALDATLRDSLTRYQKLLDSPSLTYQAEKLSKRLSKMLGSKAHPEFKDLKLPASELEGLFNAMLLEAATEFALNPAYGLDTHVSTSIRHGAFEGHLRSPLISEDLLCLKDNGDYILPPVWAQKLASLSATNRDLLQKLLAKFTQRFEEIINGYLKEKLHIRLPGSMVGMFDFTTTSTEFQVLMEATTPNTTLNDLSDRLISHCWSLTTRSLDTIRDDLLNSAAKQIGMAFDNLVKGIESKIAHSSVTPFIDSIAKARTGFQVAIEDVAEWFQRPTDLSRDPFEIEVATHVALQQIANCYVKNPIEPILDLSITEKINGKMLDGLCEILFVLLQNIIFHSGLGEQKPKVFLSAGRCGESLIFECKSHLGKEVSLNERRERAFEAMSKYEGDSALKMARKEGGSGLSKVWRIAEFDLRVTHGLELFVTDKREFIVKLSLQGLWR